MYRSVVAGAALALCLAAGPVWAEPFETFTDLCLQTNANPDAVAAAADRGAWFAMPEEAMTSLRGSPMSDAVAFMNVDPYAARGGGLPPGTEAVLAAKADGEATFGIPGSVADVCMVMLPDADTAALDEKLGRLLGFAPVSFAGESMWLFSRDGDRFRSEAALAGMDIAVMPGVLSQRPVYAAKVMNRGGLTGIIIGAMKPAP